MIIFDEREAIKVPGITAFFLSFTFNQDIINNLKLINIKNYNKKTLEWEIPISSLAETIDLLTELDDITINLLPESPDKYIEYNLSSYKTTPYPYQVEGIKYGLNHDKWLLLDDCGLGKAFSLDTKILTDHGYEEIKDIHPGTKVFDKEGKACNVLYEYNHDKLKMYELEFSTHQKVTCCEDHQWPIIEDKSVWHKDTKSYTLERFDKVVSTKWIIDNFNKFKNDHARFNFCKPVDFKERDHIIHPYILGCLIGDGALSNHSVSLTSEDTFIIDKISKLIPSDKISISKKRPLEYSFICSENCSRNIFVSEIKRLNLNCTSLEKFIPDEYLYDSIDNRLALLQGLMDTDGTVSSQKTYKGKNSNKATFGTSSEKLKNCFEFLINSLGGYISVRKFKSRYYNTKYNEMRTCSDHYTCSAHINNMQDLFSLPRKKNLCNERKNKLRLRLINIKSVGYMPGKCLTVDSPSHTYLADKCLVSHNTLQLIYLAQELKSRYNIKHCLIICGINNLKFNWKKEVERHSDTSCRILGQRYNAKNKLVIGSLKDRVNQLLNPIDEFFVVTNVETLRSDEIVDAIQKGPNSFDMIAIDEIHTIKNPSSEQGHNILKLTNAKYRIGMTGTLLLNNPLDTYVPLKWIGAEKSTFTTFKYHYCTYTGKFHNILLGFKNLNLLKYQLSKYSLRRTKDILDLPEKNIIAEYVEMDNTQANFYENIKNGIIEEVDKVKISTASLLSMISRLRQAAVMPSILSSEVDESCKLKRACGLASELINNGNKVVIFSTFKDPVYKLQEALKEFNPLIATGDLKDSEISENIDKFQNLDDNKVFIATYAKCSTGITLTRARYMICIDSCWTAAQNKQAEDRIHRIGSKEPVFIYYLIAKDTIDEHVYDIVTSKNAIADFVIDNKISEKGLESLRKYIEDLK